jgi:hypothetical protein
MNRTIRTASAAILLIVLVAGAAPAAASTTTARPDPASSLASISPASLNLYVAEGFRYQDPNMYACTSAGTMDMLNWIALRGSGGTGFRWKVNRSGATRDAILAWERTHDTLKGGNGSDPHGWRNALNYYGWGSGALWSGRRIYDDYSYGSYDGAVKASVRAIIKTRKAVGIIGWAGRHAQMIVGYYGLVGDPFAKNADGVYTNAFTVGGFYLVDPLASQGMVNVKVSYATLKSSTNLKLRFQPYLETDSPYDDPYSPSYRPSRDEWYGKFVTVMPIR